MNDDAVITRGAQPLSRTVDGDVVIFHPDRGSYFSLGDVGKRVWEIIEQPIAIDRLCKELVTEYDVEPERCRAEIEELVGQLNEAGLVELT